MATALDTQMPAPSRAPSRSPERLASPSLEARPAPPRRRRRRAHRRLPLADRPHPDRRPREPRLLAVRDDSRRGRRVLALERVDRVEDVLERRHGNRREAGHHSFALALAQCGGDQRGHGRRDRLGLGARQLLRQRSPRSIDRPALRAADHRRGRGAARDLRRRQPHSRRSLRNVDGAHAGAACS